MATADWRRVKAVFHAAVDMPEAERAGFLDKVCAGQPDVRAEVDSLLDSHSTAGDFLEVAAVRSAPEALDQEAGQRWIGQRIGQYRIVALLGQGGMGLVFRAARADRQYEAEVAIKLIRSGYDTDSVRRRFLAERQILARLTHPNIARLLDGGTTEQGQPYLVMELVAGVAIDAYCRQSRPPLKERLRLFLESCSAISYAHRHLIVHRDVKPGNIFVTADHSVKLLDFGVARALDALQPDKPPTVTLMRALSVAFSSPEQVRGEPVTTASDIYSLGVLLYHLLTGGSPYRSASGPIRDVVREICDGAIDVPSKRGGDVPEGGTAGTGERIAADLDAIVSRAMQKRVADRYPSVDALADDVRRFLEDRPVLARRAGGGYIAEKFVRRHRTLVAAGALMAILIVAGFSVLGYRLHSLGQETAAATAQRVTTLRMAESLLAEAAVATQAESAGGPAHQLTSRLRERLAELAARRQQDPAMLAEIRRLQAALDPPSLSTGAEALPNAH
jgi:tRNA A-37 threonylcarbamoyl transferase component Bud32